MEMVPILEETGEGGNVVEVVIVLGEDMVTLNDRRSYYRWFQLTIDTV